ncbi:hypothetical protein F5X97DRAFT_324041 [Nemania serpens]|nr:hypothetical protein F5X97DRAFT_324041 [Nemania serpens]
MPRKNHNKSVECNNQQVDKSAHPLTNCAFWIRGLPASTSYRQLFAALKGTGAVRHCSIALDGKNSITATASVCYFRQSSAHTLYVLSQTLAFMVNGVCPIVEWQPEPIFELSGYRNQSRGLRIRGPISIVNYRVLEEIWSGCLQWTKDCCKDSGQGEVIYFFTSWDDMSKIAKHLLVRDLREVVTVDYMRDPCD